MSGSVQRSGPRCPYCGHGDIGLISEVSAAVDVRMAERQRCLGILREAVKTEPTLEPVYNRIIGKLLEYQRDMEQ